MPTVLVTGPRYFNFLSAVKGAFARQGWNVVVEAFDTPVHPYSASMKLRYKFSRDKEALRRKGRVLFNAALNSRFDRTKPDLVFILNGDMLEIETVERFRSSGARVALWLFDNRERLPRSADLASHVDRLFCFERADAEWFRASGIDASFLPQACDTDVYRPLEMTRDIDILFVGNMWNSPKRKEAMLSVIRAFPERRVVVYGLYQPWYKGVVKWLLRPYKTIFKNCNLSPDKVNECYNRAKVVLNIHQELQTDGANPRVFEICGSGAYQLCDANNYIKSVFADGSVGLYSSVDELIQMIGKALSEDTSERAALARANVLVHHTFDVRMNEVISSIFA